MRTQVRGRLKPNFRGAGDLMPDPGTSTSEQTGGRGLRVGFGKFGEASFLGRRRTGTWNTDAQPKNGQARWSDLSSHDRRVESWKEDRTPGRLLARPGPPLRDCP